MKPSTPRPYARAILVCHAVAVVGSLTTIYFAASILWSHGYFH